METMKLHTKSCSKTKVNLRLDFKCRCALKESIGMKSDGLYSVGQEGARVYTTKLMI